MIAIDDEPFHEATEVALPAPVPLTRGARPWTADRNLAALAARLGIEFEASGH